MKITVIYGLLFPLKTKCFIFLIMSTILRTNNLGLLHVLCSLTEVVQIEKDVGIMSLVPMVLSDDKLPLPPVKLLNCW